MQLFDGFVNALCLPRKVYVESANDDSCVLLLLAMQADEVFAVNCQNSPSLGAGKSQYLIIGNLQISFASFLNGQNIVP
jgi:hypothetical protein